MATWQIQEAKSRFSEVLEDATNKGPQIITRHGTERAIILSMQDYRTLLAQKPDLKTHLLGGPKVQSFDVKRDRRAGRKVNL